MEGLVEVFCHFELLGGFEPCKSLAQIAVDDVLRGPNAQDKEAVKLHSGPSFYLSTFGPFLTSETSGTQQFPWALRIRQGRERIAPFTTWWLDRVSMFCFPICFGTGRRDKI